MTARTWDLVVRDAHRRPHRGVVLLSAVVPRRPPGPGEAFRVVLLSRPIGRPAVPDATAVCVPSVPLARPIVADPDHSLSPWLSREASAAYRAGRIDTNGAVTVSPEDVFPARGGRARIDRLCRMLIDVTQAETVAAYTAVIRHVLNLAPGADALAALHARLNPAGAADRPPRRAPAVARLRAALRDLAVRAEPDVTPGQLADDLRFLSVFDADERWSRTAAARLLGDLAAPARADGKRDRAAGTRRLRVVTRERGR